MMLVVGLAIGLMKGCRCANDWSSNTTEEIEPVVESANCVGCPQAGPNEHRRIFRLRGIVRAVSGMLELAGLEPNRLENEQPEEGDEFELFGVDRDYEQGEIVKMSRSLGQVRKSAGMMRQFIKM
jgi:hypothetical protein